MTLDAEACPPGPQRTYGPDPDMPEHIPGSSSYWYKRYKCNHAECIAKATEERAAVRNRRLAERVPDERGYLIHPKAPHNSRNGYQNYGCRCAPCCLAAGVKNPPIPIGLIPTQRQAS